MMFGEEDNIDKENKRDYVCVEFDHATTIEHLKNYKAYGVDETPAELLKYTDVDIKNELYKICM